jgi:hypothetical protein
MGLCNRGALRASEKDSTAGRRGGEGGEDMYCESTQNRFSQRLLWYDRPNAASWTIWMKIRIDRWMQIQIEMEVEIAMIVGYQP